MTQVAVMGEIPWGRPRKDTGRYLTAESFGVRRSGLCVACWNHWHDNDFNLKNQATWGVTSTGLFILHTLDDTVEIEAALIKAVYNLRLEFSFGLGTSPGAARDVLAASQRRQIAYKEEALTNVLVEHIAYVPEGAYEQLPIRALGPVPV